MILEMVMARGLGPRREMKLCAGARPAPSIRVAAPRPLFLFRNRYTYWRAWSLYDVDVGVRSARAS